VVALAAHNFPITAWPVLLGVMGAHRQKLTRRLADVLVAGWLAVNVLPVGAAIGAYGSPLLPYVPQLPLEWAALSLGASGWLLQRHGGIATRAALVLLVLVALTVLGAAALETIGPPHRSRTPPRALFVTDRVLRDRFGGQREAWRNCGPGTPHEAASAFSMKLALAPVYPSRSWR
jgi:hypothetical protein